jgi:molecular chaperone HscB
MNYFELFEIPVGLNVDKSLVSQKYFELQKKYHPDFFTNATEEEQSDALEKSSIINKAFKTLQDEDATLKYLLELKGILTEEEKYELPPAFLMEMMELNETLVTEDTTSVRETEQKIKHVELELDEGVKSIISGYKETETSNEKLIALKAYYYKKKYLKRILDRIEGIRNIAPL